VKGGSPFTGEAGAAGLGSTTGGVSLGCGLGSVGVGDGDGDGLGFGVGEGDGDGDGSGSPLQPSLMVSSALSVTEPEVMTASAEVGPPVG